jgi:hypothetical protein
MERHEWSAWMGFLSLVAILFGVVVGIGFTLGIGRSFLSTKVDDGDATRARCVQDCKSWARERTDEDREFCAEPERNCKGGPERFDESLYHQVYMPGSVGRRASCTCQDRNMRSQELWAGGGY